MFFQRKISKTKSSKNSDGSPKKGNDNHGKTDLIDRAKEGIGALAGSLQSAKNDTKAKAANLQEDVKAGIATVLHNGSDILEKAKGVATGHAEAAHLREQEQGSAEQGSKDMEAFSAVIDKVKNPETVEKVKEETVTLAEAFHLGKHESKEKEPETKEKAKEGESTQSAPVDDSTATNNIEVPNVVEQAVEEIQTVVATVQHSTRAETETETPTEPAAAASAEGAKPVETQPRGEKDDPSKRINFFGFFAMLFERFCSPADKKKD